jgi:hypothetical protein
MNSDDLLTTTIKFLKDQTASMDYGEVGVKLIFYGGRLSRIERQILEKDQAEEMRNPGGNRSGKPGKR